MRPQGRFPFQFDGQPVYLAVDDGFAARRGIIAAFDSQNIIIGVVGEHPVTENIVLVLQGDLRASDVKIVSAFCNT